MRKDVIDHAAELVFRRLAAPLGSRRRQMLVARLRRALVGLTPEEHSAATYAGERRYSRWLASRQR